jgi:hypothetical protein
MAVENAFPKVDGDVAYGSEYNFQSGNMVTVEAGENIATGNICYIHLTDGKAYVSDTGTAADIRANGIAIAGVSSGADVTLQTSGVWITTGLSDKVDYYLGAAGALSATVHAVRIGTANGTTQLYINILQDDRDLPGTIKAWHKSLTGAPSTYSAFWHECDGTALTGGSADAESPFNGQTLPDLNVTSRFIYGDAISGTTGGNSDHTHGFSATHNAGSGGTSVLANQNTNGILTGGTIPPYMTMVFLIKWK